jgi:hypothetical protein
MRMNPFVAYAKLPMSFRKLYQSRGGGRGNFLVAVACAMTGLLIVNIWSVLLIVVSVTHTSLVGKHHIEAGPYALLLAFVFGLEILFVRFVFRRADSDPTFAEQVRSTRPMVSMWYAGISAGLLAASTVAMFFTS